METGRDEVAVTRVQRALVRAFAPPSEAVQLLEDLTEEASQIMASQGARAARRWVRWQVAHSAAPWIARRIREVRQHRSGADMMIQRGLWSDIRIAARRLAHSPAFTALACLTLAIGICAVSTVFSLAYALWLKPLPYADPDRLVWIQSQHQPSGTAGSLTLTELTEYQRGSRSLTEVAGFVYGAHVARLDGEPVRIVAHYVSANLFRVLGIRPAIGRDFTPGDAGSGMRILMLSHALWARRFGKDPAIVGKAVTLDAESYEVIGVMPPGFVFPRVLEAEAWIPSTFDMDGFRKNRLIQAIARLAPGHTLADAAAEADLRMKALAATLPASDTRWIARVIPAGETASRSSQLAFQALLGIVGLFLLIACFNLAGLLLARNSARRTELAVRLAIGGSRWRLVRMVLVESTLLAAIGCIGGVLLASYASSAVAALMPPRTPGLDDVHVSGPVVMVAAAVSVLAAVLVGLVPAISLRRMVPATALSGSRRVAHGMARAQRALVVVEVALAVVLVVGAGLMLRTFVGMLERDRGYDPHGLQALDVSLPFSDDSYLPTETRARAFDEILARASAVPGVRSAAATTGFPGSPLGILTSAAITPQDGGAQIICAVHAASAAYFTTMGIPIKAGRAFSLLDSTEAPRVAIVNEQLAREFAAGNPIGRQIPLTIPGEKQAWFEIVGVVGDIRLTDRAGYRVFVPLSQASSYWIDLVVRSDGGGPVVPAVRRALRGMNKDLLLENESSFQTIISNSLAIERAQSAFAAVIGFLSVIVAGVGLYALMAFVIAQRRRELSVRLALGSPPRRLFRETIAGGLRLVVAGVAAGELSSILLVRMLSTRVFGLASADVSGYAGAAALVIVIAVVAMAIPARQVLRTDPLVALRAD